MTTGLDVATLRNGAVLVPALLAGVLWVAAPAERVGAALATLWNVVWLAVLNAVAIEAGWWAFGTDGLMWSGMPLDVVLGWALLWGAVPVLLMRWVNPLVTVAVLVAADIVEMGGLAPLVSLRSGWWAGELLGVLLCLLPAVLLGWATAAGRMLWVRAGLQVVLFGALLLFVIPAATFALTGTSWLQAWHRIGGPADGALLQIAAVLVLIALSAVAEFARHGGTPFPWDPPQALVTSGPYAYLANPMQVCAVLLLVTAAAVVGAPGLVLAAAISVVFSAGIAGWHERDQLVARFGAPWQEYRRAVHDWVPRLRPYPHRAPARLYVAVTCDPCSQVAGWLRRRHPVALTLEPAEDHPQDLRRVRYESDSVVLQGTRAVGAALEHISLGWALVGWVMRAPVIGWFVQLLADAVGAGPRSVSR
ncbi:MULTISPECIES: methyltransferase family protein [unclassified Mycolicibacterium]|uniref:methyltransferase family protein n=1 Tax=unclassified Mycolicibacterium TaxID=2636767 RepID=UPI002EDA1928